MFNPDEIEKVFRSVMTPGFLKGIDNMNAMKNTGDEVLKHTRMEELVYKEKRSELESRNDDTLKSLEDQGKEKLESFPSLSQDLFTGFYNLNPSFRNDEELSFLASKFNKTIIEGVLNDEKYLVIKQITEGRDFESIEAVKEFLQSIFSNLDNLLKDISGEKKTLEVMENIGQKMQGQIDELSDLMAHYNELKQGGNDSQAEALEPKIKSLSNEIESKDNQLDHLQKILEGNKMKNKDKIDSAIDQALERSLEKVEEIRDILNAWGTESPEQMSLEAKEELINKVQRSPRFRDMSKLVGKYRVLASKEMKNSYVYGLGVKYDIELGRDLNRVISSELVNLAVPALRPEFVKKYQTGRLKQYRKREPVKKGCGNILMAGDESSSTRGGKDFWCKAMAVSLLDVALRNNKNFGYVHFSTVTVTDEISKDNYNLESVMRMASMFLGGGTSFEVALREIMRLIEMDKYRGADVVFVTDGECNISDAFLQELLEYKRTHKFKLIGILLDKGEGDVTDITLKKFCDKIYKTSELSEDEIAQNIFKSVV